MNMNVYNAYCLHLTAICRINSIQDEVSNLRHQLSRVDMVASVHQGMKLSIIDTTPREKQRVNKNGLGM